MFALIKKFFAAVADGSKGLLNAEELFRSLVTSIGSGSFVGIALTIATAMLSHVAAIFPNPAVASMATMFLTLVVDLLRRLNQGGKPDVVVIPTPPGPVGPSPVVKLADAHPLPTDRVA